MAVKRHNSEDEPQYPKADPLFGLKPTPSMRATLKYFWVVAALFRRNLERIQQGDRR